MNDKEYRYLIDCGGEAKWFTVKMYEGDAAKNTLAVFIKDGSRWQLGAILKERVILWHEV